jgi:hypothetical protein
MRLLAKYTLFNCIYNPSPRGAYMHYLFLRNNIRDFLQTKSWDIPYKLIFVRWFRISRLFLPILHGFWEMSIFSFLTKNIKNCEILKVGLLTYRIDFYTFGSSRGVTLRLFITLTQLNSLTVPNIQKYAIFLFRGNVHENR